MLDWSVINAIIFITDIMTKVNPLFFVSIIILLLLSACTQKTKITLLEPALIDIKAKNIAVLPFKNDTQIGMSGEIESNLNAVRFNAQPYFKMVDRKVLNKVLNEQKRQQSGLFDEGMAAEMGALIGAEVLVSGDIVSLELSYAETKEKRRECRKKKCRKKEDYHYYTVPCLSRRVNLVTNIRVIQVSSAEVLHSEKLKAARVNKQCEDGRASFISKVGAGQSMAKSMAKTFVKKLVPYYSSRQVSLLDDEDIEYTEREQALLKNALLFIKQNRLDKAEPLLMDLLKHTGFKSYVAAYNLGVVKEAQADLTKASEYYQLADQLQIEPVEEINAAINRIKVSKFKSNKAKAQLHRNLAR